MLDTETHPGNWLPSSDIDRQRVKSELERMLESPLFSNSKRYPALLRYLVEQTLEGREELLKERLLGIAVFHRAPDYDTNQDTVVRLAAGEVRKRIAQFYHEQGDSPELEIDLRPGSYVPVFRRTGSAAPENGLAAAGASLLPEGESLTNLAREATSPASLASAVSPAPQRHRIWLFAAALVALMGIAAGIGWWQANRSARTANRQLWSPILTEPGQVRLVLADLSAGLAYRDTSSGSENGILVGLLRMGEIVNYRDALAESGIVTFLTRNNKPFTLQLSTQATYPDLQHGASILIGGLDNVWTLRLTDPLRYHFVRRATPYVFAIEDRIHPELGGWHLDLGQPADHSTEDFAIVARIFDQTTARPVLVVAGLGANGTSAAAEFLLDPARTAEIASHAPKNWQRLNMEAVIRTQILDNHAGPPHVVACVFW